MNKGKVSHGLQEIGAAWAIRSDKYVCTNHQCCNVLEGDRGRPAYHVHPDASEPRDIYIKRFKSLDEIADYINARKAAAEAKDESAAYRVMEDFWASLP